MLDKLVFFIDENTLTKNEINDLKKIIYNPYATDKHRISVYNVDDGIQLIEHRLDNVNFIKKTDTIENIIDEINKVFMDKKKCNSDIFIISKDIERFKSFYNFIEYKNDIDLLIKKLFNKKCNPFFAERKYIPIRIDNNEEIVDYFYRLKMFENQNRLSFNRLKKESLNNNYETINYKSIKNLTKEDKINFPEIEKDECFFNLEISFWKKYSDKKNLLLNKFNLNPKELHKIETKKRKNWYDYKNTNNEIHSKTFVFCPCCNKISVHSGLENIMFEQLSSFIVKCDHCNMISYNTNDLNINKNFVFEKENQIKNILYFYSKFITFNYKDKKFSYKSIKYKTEQYIINKNTNNFSHMFYQTENANRRIYFFNEIFSLRVKRYFAIYFINKFMFEKKIDIDKKLLFLLDYTNVFNSFIFYLLCKKHNKEVNFDNLLKMDLFYANNWKKKFESIKEKEINLNNYFELFINKKPTKFMLNNFFSIDDNEKINSPYAFKSIILYLYKHFKDVNHANELTKMLLKCESTYGYDKKTFYDYFLYVFKTFKDEITIYNAFKRVLKNDTFIEKIRDSNESLRKIIKLKGKIYLKNLNYNEKFDVTKFHDFITFESLKLTDIKKEFKYNEKFIDYFEKNYDIDNKKYEFVLSKDSFNLILIGKELKHCVGTYQDSVFFKKCFIVSFYVDKVLKGCMEIRYDGNIFQFKGKHNKLIGEEYKDVLTKYIDDTYCKYSEKDLKDYFSKNIINKDKTEKIKKILKLKEDKNVI